MFNENTPETELRDAIARGNEATNELNRRFNSAAEITDRRLRRLEHRDAGIRAGAAFLPSELMFAATARCVCGAGLAYPHQIGVSGSWYCSAILQAQAQPGTTHDGAKPFAFFEILSEGQPSARGATTRAA